MPGIPGLADVPYLDNSSMMGVDFLPEHLVIVAGSYLGLAFGQMYRGFGSAVTIIELGPRLLGLEDEAVSAAVQSILEAEVRMSGRPALVATQPMARVSRGFEKCETQGFLKILVDAQTNRILSGSFLGIGGDEVIHLILDIMYARVPHTVIQRAIHIHPTVSEDLPTLLGDLKPL